MGWPNPGGPLAELAREPDPDAPAMAEAPNAMAASAATPATVLMTVFDIGRPFDAVYAVDVAAPRWAASQTPLRGR